MIYGLYLSAAGIVSSSYRQDVIANNLANSETVGFKRDLPLFQERLTAAQERHGAGQSNALMEGLGGGLLAAPNLVDTSTGELENTGSPLDVALQGSGFFTVDDHGKTRLTRNGRFMVDRGGDLVLADTPGNKVLDDKGKPIRVAVGAAISFDPGGNVCQNNQPVARLGVSDVSHPEKLVKLGSTLMSFADNNDLKPSSAIVRGEFIERSNVDPTTEMAQLMDAQRQLEANANMIRYQDQTLQLLCNTVGKIS